MWGRLLGVLALGFLVGACGGTTSNSDGGGSGAGGSGGSGGGSAGSGGGSAGGSTASGGGSTASGVGGSVGGSGGSAGGAGTGSELPNLVVDQYRAASDKKLDVLFVVDNSISMADKQGLLSLAVPRLLEALVNPDCVQVDDDGKVLDRQPAGLDVDMPCQVGWDLEQNPVDDIHIGVITSSLGGRGGETCSPDGGGATSWNETKNDRGHLMPTVRPDLNLPADDPTGFLVWDPDVSVREELKSDFAEHVQAAGEVGCGYEAPLEAWYRFLVDPSPPLDIVVQNNVAGPALDDDGNIIVDTTVLEQREAFLRPDSIVVVAMFSDENDCSVDDSGIGWLTAATFTLPAQTVECDANPNDPCCRSCGITTTVPGCSASDSDPNCIAGREPDSDALNLRCYNQKQRFGFDLLHPIERYVDALRAPRIYDTHRCDVNDVCPLVQNPLFEVRDGATPRDPSQVYLAGIVGVPWQDLATPDSLASQDSLEFMSARELADNGRWEMMLGNPDAENPKAPDALPTDPLMIEQSEPREGVHPITGEALAPVTSTDPSANSINGHEYVNDDDSDLQYACIFPLAEPRDCSNGENLACDCNTTDVPKNRPLCNPPGGGEVGELQYYAKAYPAPRLLQTLRDLGDNAIVASMCPRLTSGEPDHPAFGYNAAISAIVDSTKGHLRAGCLPRALSADEEGRIACTIVEVIQGAQDCDPAQGRSDVDQPVVAAVTERLEALGHCGGATGLSCDELSQCTIEQLSGDDQQECQSSQDYQGSVPGFCYVDAAQGVGNEDLLAGCPATQMRKLQFVGADTPALGALSFVVCEEQ